MKLCYFCQNKVYLKNRLMIKADVANTAVFCFRDIYLKRKNKIKSILKYISCVLKPSFTSIKAKIVFNFYREHKWKN